MYKTPSFGNLFASCNFITLNRYGLKRLCPLLYRKLKESARGFQKLQQITSFAFGSCIHGKITNQNGGARVRIAGRKKVLHKKFPSGNDVQSGISFLFSKKGGEIVNFKRAGNSSFVGQMEGIIPAGVNFCIISPLDVAGQGISNNENSFPFGRFDVGEYIEKKSPLRFWNPNIIRDKEIQKVKR